MRLLVVSDQLSEGIRDRYQISTYLRKLKPLDASKISLAEIQIL